MRTTLLALAAGGVLAAGLAVPASANHGTLTVTGLTVNERLVTFAANDPGTILTEVRVSGVVGDLQGIDFRPANGGLYGVAVAEDGGRLYRIDPATGVATQVGSTVLALTGEVSIDVNPDVDRLRVVSTDGDNLRLNLDTGALASTDRDLAYAAGDPAAGTAPTVAAVAYSGNDAATTTATVLYDVDAALSTLLVQAPPNDGVLTTRGALPQASRAEATGFDIYTRTNGSGTNWAFVSLTEQGRTTFYEIDLATGRPVALATSPANPATGTVIGGRPFVTDIAVRPAQGL